jgi:LPS-assembly protein
MERTCGQAAVRNVSHRVVPKLSFRVSERYAENLLLMRARLCVFITLFALSHPQVGAQALTKQFPQSGQRPAIVESQHDSSDIPVAQPEIEKPPGTDVVIRARTQTKQGSVYTLRGDVEIHYKSYVIRADVIRYDTATGEMTADGHLRMDGGPRDEHISATNGTLNVDRQTGRFYNVTGAIGGSSIGHSAVYDAANPATNGTLNVDRLPGLFYNATGAIGGGPIGRNAVYGAANPFLFTGKIVEKNGPDNYVVHEGSMTSCSLPKPDWVLSANLLQVKGTTATAKNVLFRLLNIPVVYLPYVTHGTDVQERHSGFLIPTIGTSSTKGTILGETIYIVLGRSADLTVGSEYYSKRGFAQAAEFRYKGNGLDGLRVRYTGLLDRGLGPTHIDQGGEDITVAGRRDFTQYTRVVADAEYLSSYQYRQAFTESFLQAVASEVKSVVFATHEKNGVVGSARFDRFQSFQNVTLGQEVRILHLPSVDGDVADHALGNTPLYYGLETSAAGLTRSETGFNNASPTARFDLHPHITLPLVFAGATLRPSVGFRETFYSTQGVADSSIPVQVNKALARNAFEAGVEARTPTLERVFGTASKDATQWKHTISGYAKYRYVAGIDNFSHVLRYDPIDVVSDTNEIEYGVTQRLFHRSLLPRPCKPDEVPDLPGSTDCRDTYPTEWLSWRVAQKYFFDPTFGGAVVPGRRNVLATTLDFSAAAYLLGPRAVSPLLSELRIRPTEHIDLESDLEYDTKAGRVAAANVFADYRRGDYFAGFGHSRLDAPGEPVVAGSVNTTSKFNQLRFALGYGSVYKRGLSAAASAGLDLELDTVQYGAVQTNYNWDCCGVSIEYRRFSLGSARNENQYRFNFTLAGVGTAGNLRRAERLF